MSTSRLLFGIGILAASLFFLGASVHAQTPCHKITAGGGVPSGFGVPYDVTSTVQELLISVSCNVAAGTATVDVGSGSSLQYVYQLAHSWNGTGWQQINLTGSNLQGGAWYVGNAQGTVQKTAAQFAENNFVVAYICTWTGTAWKCGCQNAACATPSWQMQYFAVAGAGSSSGGSTSSGGTSSGGTSGGGSTSSGGGTSSGGSSSGGSTTVIRPIQGDKEVLVSDLDTPWDMAFLPDGTMLLTERRGNIIHIGAGLTKTVTSIPNVHEDQESGMHGIALHPNFAQNKFVYVYYMKGSGGSNRVERYTFNDSTKKVENPTIILDGIPASNWHDGGRIRFGPDGFLYIATGDASNSGNAQNTGSLAGKILRVTDTGAAAPGNPFNNRTYSYGHRNPQGLAWDSSGRLWAAEHGPSNADTGCDEVNLIEAGKNYGWPSSTCGNVNGGTVAPKHQTGRGNTWAPSGIAFWNNRVLVAGLAGNAIYELNVNGTSLGNIETHFKREYGRLRAISVGPDGNIYFSTSNRDQHGTARSGDDKIIRINPSAHF